MTVMDMLAEIFEDAPEIRPDSPSVRSAKKLASKGYSPISPISPSQGKNNYDRHETDEIIQAGIPEPCRGCSHLELLSIQGIDVAGCVQTLEMGCWSQEWRRMPLALKECKSRKPENTETNHGCGADFIMAERIRNSRLFH